MSVNQINELTNLPNIGNILAEKLAFIGIHTIDELKSNGAEKVFIKLKSIDKDVCINTLFAIEGAIQEIRWHSLEKSRKMELNFFFKKTNKL